MKDPWRLRDSQREYPAENWRSIAADRRCRAVPRWALWSRRAWRKYQKRFWSWTIDQYREAYRA